VRVRTHVLHRPPVKGLIEAAKRVDLLVVGAEVSVASPACFSAQ
jgi:hypothetical protein